MPALPVQLYARSPVPGEWPDPAADLFQPVEEHLCGWAKPSGGGLWTSSLMEDGSSDWIRWCLAEGFQGPDFDLWHLTPKPNARVYEITDGSDLIELGQRFPPVCDHEHPCPDRHLSSGVSWRRVAEFWDGVRLTEEGQWATRLTSPNLYGWDCESTLWLRWAFSSVEHVGARTFDGAIAHY